MRRRAQPEYALQCAVVEHLRRRAPKTVRWWHTPNGGYRGVREAGRLKRMGVLPGVSDIIAVRQGGIFCLELKSPNGRLSQDQADFLDFMETIGAGCCVCNDLDGALAVLKKWGIIR